MPKRIPADRNAILDLYEQLGNAQEVARRMNLHPGTVYKAIRLGRGLCAAGCNRPAKANRAYCEPCLERLAKRSQAVRAERRRLGLCFYCDERVDAPVSRQFCAVHRIEQLDKQRDRATQRHKERTKAGPLTTGVALAKRERTIKWLYRPGGMEAWERDRKRCVICGTHFGQAKIHIHHIDLDGKNNAAENLVCLCFDCHELVHRLLRARKPTKAVTWTRRTYPGFQPPPGYDADLAFVTESDRRHAAASTPPGRSA
jgi:5-methylcytosine-specific restriction endonuclease McrA